MSAAATQQRLAKTTSWLAQLKGNAEHAGFTAEDTAQKAQERYGKPMDELTVTEAQTLAWEYSDISQQKAEAVRAAMNPQNGSHLTPIFSVMGQCRAIARIAAKQSQSIATATKDTQQANG
jgi:hypothetical protein